MARSRWDAETCANSLQHANNSQSRNLILEVTDEKAL